ncbi:lysine transporter LysE [Lampropedia puyangensis]|uniref:Lysine transporter LysE n=1 Tax=Lampropedia puyangensis TaxID=1330072 RepID=A0A4S8ESW7_9BURK|nr:LysE family transporter [Lampropedia puyangensis]THT97458.1 lysine transporter LysE [Lampropedia puyangensis]
MQSLPVFFSGMTLSLSLIMAIGPQNAHVLRMGLTRQHVALTVLLCMLTDMVLISIGVYGFAALGEMPEKIHGALVGAGALFLIHYGSQAASRFWQAWRRTPQSVSSHHISIDADDAQTALQRAQISRKQAVAIALAFSWLNPHAWLDTAVLIGSASLAYGSASHWFGWGAITGSLVWFLLLGSCAYWLGQRLHNTRLWVWLDAVVAIMMWTLAFWLVRSLLTP